METSNPSIQEEFKAMMDGIFTTIQERFKDSPIVSNFAAHNVQQFYTYLVSVNNVLLGTEILKMVSFVIENNIKHPSMSV